ncbi:hypothetical protein [Herpetosiphon gulosus]|uniref:Protein-export membrane protein SecG n=1 Tax=Herpetosiphon gulosus TaxID=1973496 RepID=A0ABP9X8P9_9CHLR|nr:hypothetical protein [Chloroflexota bacterium]
MVLFAVLLILFGGILLVSRQFREQWFYSDTRRGTDAVFTQRLHQTFRSVGGVFMVIGLIIVVINTI